MTKAVLLRLVLLLALSFVPAESSPTVSGSASAGEDCFAGGAQLTEEAGTHAGYLLLTAYGQGASLPGGSFEPRFEMVLVGPDDQLRILAGVFEGSIDGTQGGLITLPVPELGLMELELEATRPTSLPIQSQLQTAAWGDDEQGWSWAKVIAMVHAHHATVSGSVGEYRIGWDSDGANILGVACSAAALQVQHPTTPDVAKLERTPFLSWRLASGWGS